MIMTLRNYCGTLAETKSESDKDIAKLKEYENNAQAFDYVQIQLVDLTKKDATLSQGSRN